jgi:sialate O-acetylesterase
MKSWCLPALALLAAAPSPAAPSEHALLADVFQDHAVLQRDRPVAVWGNALPGDEISISINVESANAVADAQGRWRTQLKAMPAGGPYTLTAQARSGARQTLRDVLLGDVWLCSGQSNMEFPVSSALNAAREISGAGSDSIRLLSVANATSPTAQAHFLNPLAWVAASPASVREFSAACYYFARDLQRSVRVPMGLIQATWSGSRIEPWISAAALRKLGGFEQGLGVLGDYARDPRAGNERMGAVWESWWRRHAPQGSAPWLPNGAGDWRAVPEPMRDWKTWGVPELAAHDGMVWFRRSVTLSKAQAASSASISIGAIDEVDETWINGHPIANSFGYGTERSYEVPKGLLHAGENTIVINVLSTWDAGGMYGPADHMALSFADASRVPLGGNWQYQFVPESMGSPPRAPWESVAGLSSIHNAMIAPLAPFCLRGVLWYQGESNTGEADRYQALLTSLMADWRGAVADELPFLIVELPNFGAPSTAPAASGWAALREAQRRAAAADAHAALIVTIDLGDPRELHPPDKQAVADRLARAARHLIYGESLTASGPSVQTARREGNAVTILFTQVDGTLVTYSSLRPSGFELCAQAQASCRFADGTVQDQRVVLDAAGIPASRVRYCWGDAPSCNLYDKSGLPAGPFEIDIDSARGR